MTEKIKRLFATREMVYLVLAFASVYIIWGSTYLGIKYAIETIPSFMMAAVRFLTAGAILYTVGRISPSYERPTREQWKTSFIMGALLLGIGNGGVVVAEHYLSSSLTALLIATNPFWIVLITWLFMGHRRPGIKVVAGLAAGFAGVMMLILGRGASTDAGGSQYFGVLMIMLATIGWAIGSLYGRGAPTAKNTFLAAGMQMLAGGLILLVMSLVLGEFSKFDPAQVSRNSLIALAYLILIGAVVAYTAYSWLIKNASPAAVSTYAYVNPAIAVVLGWAIAGESLTTTMLFGAAAIVGSVVLITGKKAPEKEAADNDERVDEAEDIDEMCLEASV